MNSQVFRTKYSDDDKGIRDCLKRNPMKGVISLAFETEPSFFDSLSVQGDADVIVAKNNDKVVGVGTRAVRPMYVNGNVQKVGYLGGLRLDKEARNRNLLKQGSDVFRELHYRDPQEFYLTSIMETNYLARKIIEKKRRVMPVFYYLYDLIVYTIKPIKRRSKTTIEIVSGKNLPIDKILEFIDCYGSEKQFFPYFTTQDFSLPITNGLEQRDFVVGINKNSEIVGVVAKWDQSDFKQTRVASYKEPLRTLRPIMNLLSPITNNPVLPEEGQKLNAFYSAFNVIANNDPLILSQLLKELSYSNLDYSYFNIGIAANDVLNKSIKFPCRKTVFRIYGFTYENNEEIFSTLKQKIPYLEIAML